MNPLMNSAISFLLFLRDPSPPEFLRHLAVGEIPGSLSGNNQNILMRRK
jgi:hypothetical protein